MFAVQWIQVQVQLQQVHPLQLRVATVGKVGRGVPARQPAISLPWELALQLGQLVQ